MRLTPCAAHRLTPHRSGRLSRERHTTGARRTCSPPARRLAPRRYSTTDEDSPIKVADFGLARVISNKEMMKTACGTPVTLMSSAHPQSHAHPQSCAYTQSYAYPKP